MDVPEKVFQEKAVFPTEAYQERLQGKPFITAKEGLTHTLTTDSWVPTPVLQETATVLPTDAKTRKNIPITTGVLDYFPDAIAAVAECSRVGNDQHNPGEPLHWARGKSTDQADCIARHLIDRGKIDTDGVRHSAKVAWRALALLQLEIEASR